ncbi:MAG: hypothetical protein AAF560_08650, partial [Acidobacteriota bacterium]
VVDAQVSTIDIAPTILSALGIEAPSSSPAIDGRSLLPLLAGGEENVAGADTSRRAWSYAASTNYGLALRIDDRLKYVFNNTAWPESLAGDQLFDLRADAEERNDIAGASEQRVVGLRSHLMETLKQGSHGVRVHFTSASPERADCGDLEGRLSGSPVHISQVKAERLPANALQWLGKRRMRFRVDAGTSYNLLLEAARGALTLQGEISSCAGSTLVPFRATVDLDALADSWTLAFDGSDWREQPVESAVAQIRLERRGIRGASHSKTEVDPALVEQLRALGYLN